MTKDGKVYARDRSLTLFLVDLHKKKLSRHKHGGESGEQKLCAAADSCPHRRRLSFTAEPEEVIVVEPAGGGGGAATVNLQEKPELTCISEEGIADMDLPDNLLDDLDYIGDCITSCNKVENYLMLSEFENNLIAEMPVIMDRKGRRWSLAKQTDDDTVAANPAAISVGSKSAAQSTAVGNAKWKLVTGPNRLITVIDEASV